MSERIRFAATEKIIFRMTATYHLGLRLGEERDGEVALNHDVRTTTTEFSDLYKTQARTILIRILSWRMPY